MKKLSLYYLTVVICFLVFPLCASAYTINDSPNDRIGDLPFETYGIDVISAYGPGPMTIKLYSNYPQSGYTVGVWETLPADIFLDVYPAGGSADGIYNYAIPLIDHDGFTAGHVYALGTFFTSTEIANMHGAGGYTFNRDLPVWLKTYQDVSTGVATVTWSPIGSNPEFAIITLPSTFINPDYRLNIFWATSTCANDYVSGSVPVPEPGILILLGISMMSVAGLRRWLKT